MLLEILLKRHEHRGGYWRIKLLWTILEEQFLLPRVGCYDNSDVIATVIIKEFESLANTTFQIFLYGDIGNAQT